VISNEPLDWTSFGEHLHRHLGQCHRRELHCTEEKQTSRKILLCLTL